MLCFVLLVYSVSFLESFSITKFDEILFHEFFLTFLPPFWKVFWVINILSTFSCYFSCKEDSNLEFFKVVLESRFNSSFVIGNFFLIIPLLYIYLISFFSFSFSFSFSYSLFYEFYGNIGLIWFILKLFKIRFNF